MIGAVREWLMAVVSCAVALTVVDNLLPEGTIRKIASMTGGLVLLAVLVQPLKTVRLDALAGQSETYRAALAECREELEQGSAQTLAQGIAEETEAYISDQAAQEGILCSAEVDTRIGPDGVPLPYSAVLSCRRTENLASYMAQELGIPEERQVFS